MGIKTLAEVGGGAWGGRGAGFGGVLLPRVLHRGSTALWLFVIQHGDTAAPAFSSFPNKTAQK